MWRTYRGLGALVLHSHLYARRQEFVQDVRTRFHQFDVKRSRIGVLPISYGIRKAIVKLVARPKQIRFHEIHHGIILICKHLKRR